MDSERSCALSSSGDTEQFVEIGGKHFLTSLTRETGLALSGRVQATVIAPHGLESDPLSLCFDDPFAWRSEASSWPATRGAAGLFDDWFHEDDAVWGPRMRRHRWRL